MAPAQRQPSIRPRLEDKNQVQSESSQEGGGKKQRVNMSLLFREREDGT